DARMSSAKACRSPRRARSTSPWWSTLPLSRRDPSGRARKPTALALARKVRAGRVGPRPLPPADAALEVVVHLVEIARERARAEVLPAAVRQQGNDRPRGHPLRLARGGDEDRATGRPAEDPLAVDEIAEGRNRVGVADEVLGVEDRRVE